MDILSVSLNTDREKIIFCLLELDGKNRQKALGISGLHYRNKVIATKWLQKFKTHLLATDTAALNKINDIYQEMIH